LLPKRRTPPSQTWRTFLTNHVRDLVSIDFFIVPTVRLRVLFAFVVLAHDRRRVLHFNVTEYPTAAWTAQQIVDAFPHDSAPSYRQAARRPTPNRSGVLQWRLDGPALLASPPVCSLLHVPWRVARASAVVH